MEFDFAPMPLPFRMQPGLRRIAAEAARLTPLAPGSPLYLEKQRVSALNGALHSVPGFDPAPALRAIEAFAGSGSAVIGASPPLELRFEEDFAVLDGDSGAVPWMCVCVPSHWAPEDKLGLSLTTIHAPVADNAMLLAAMAPLAQRLTDGSCRERHVWTISPSARHDQHPRRHMRPPWPAAHNPGEFAQCCFLRVERQTFLPVLNDQGQPARQAVFAIRVMLRPLPRAVRTAAQARRLHDSLASMSPAVLAYKGLAEAREPLLAWLRQRLAAADEP